MLIIEHVVVLTLHCQVLMSVPDLILLSTFRTVERNELVSEIGLLKKEAERSLDELTRMKNLKYEKERVGTVLQSELEAL